MKRRTIITIFATLAVCVFIIGPGIYVASRFVDGFWYNASPYPFPKTLIVEKASPNRKYVAKIIFEEATKNYLFAISGVDGTQLILSETFIPSSGYHEPIVTLTWRNSEIVTINIDRDFGDDNLLYEFNLKQLSFIEAGSNPAFKRDALKRAP